MLDDLLSKIILGWVRHLVSGLGGYLLAHGYLDAQQSDQMTGAVLVLLPLLLSAYQKWDAQNKANAKIIAAATSPATALVVKQQAAAKGKL